METHTGFCNAIMRSKAVAVIGIVFYVTFLVLMMAAAFMPKGPPPDQIQQQIKSERTVQ